MKVSAHFSRSEFACKCGCGFETVDVELLHVLETVREHFKSPVTITSACRCKDHNEDVGGRAESKHLLGIAADIVVHGVDSHDVYDFIDSNFRTHTNKDRYGIGKYNDFTHIDVREKGVRW